MRLVINSQLWSIVFALYIVALIIMNVIPNFTPTSLQLDGDSVFRTDYILHILVFILLPVMYYFSRGRTFADRLLKNRRFIFIAGLFFSMFVELIQLGVPGRTFNPMDMVFNGGGYLLGVGVVVLMDHRGSVAN
jgi:VanZ family protein